MTQQIDLPQKYYYVRDDFFIPGISLCMLVDLNGVLQARGVSICSLLDNYNKCLGRDIALGRAIKTFSSSKNLKRIPKFNRTKSIPITNTYSTYDEVDEIIRRYPEIYVRGDFKYFTEEDKFERVKLTIYVPYHFSLDYVQDEMNIKYFGEFRPEPNKREKIILEAIKRRKNND